MTLHNFKKWLLFKRLKFFTTEEQQELAFKVFSDINGNDPSPWDVNDHPEVDTALLNNWVLHLKNPKNIKKLFKYDENLIKSLICFIYHGN